MAEKLKNAGHDVTYVTPASVVSSWTAMTDEQGFIQSRLMALGVDLLLSHGLAGATRNEARFACAYTGREKTLPLGTLILVTGKVPEDALYHALAATHRCAIGDADRRLLQSIAYCGRGLLRPSLRPRIRRSTVASAPLRRERPERMSRRRDRPTRTVGAIAQRPWKQFSLPYEPIEILSADQVERIHDTALTILEEIGMKVLEPRARDYYRSAGAKIEPGEMRVRFDRAMVEELIAKAPAEFTLEARNPAKNVKVGKRNGIFSSVGGPAYVMDLEGGRRAGTYAEMCDYLKVVQVLDILHQEGGGPFEPLDLPAEHAPSRFILCRDHVARQELAAAGPRHRALDRCARNGGDLARHDARGLDRQAGLHLHHQHQFAVAARHADGGRPDDLCRARPMRGGDAVHAGRRHVAR